MRDITTLRIEIDGLRTCVGEALVSRNAEINRLVIDSLEKQLTEEWVMAEIDKSVKSCLTSAIENIANDYHMRNAITDLISNVVVKKIGEVKC